MGELEKLLRWTVLFLLGLAGCGGGGGPSGPGAIKVTAAFDPYTRTVPGYADRLEVTILAPPGTVLPPGTPNLANLTRTSTQFTFSNLPAAKGYQLTMRAFTEGAVVGTALTVLDVNAGQTATLDASNNLTTTIARIDVTGPQFATANWLQMAATAKNAAGQVLFSGEGFSWGAMDPSIVAVDSEGRMLGLRRGYTSVVAWVSNPVIAGEKLVGSMGYVPTRIVTAGVGGTATGMRDVDGEWYWTYNDPLGTATDVAIDEQERIYLAIGTKIVRVDDLSGFGRVERDVGFSPLSLDVDGDGKIYMLDAANRQVVRIDDMTGANQVAYGSIGIGAGQFMNPTSLTVGREGAIYVTDAFNDRIARFEDMNGQNWRTFGTTGSGVGQFNDPNDVDSDEDGWIYVMDSGNYRVCRFFTINGGFWTTYGSQGSTVGKFGRNTFLTIDQDSFIYVHDASNNRVVRMSSIAGDFWVSFTLPTQQSNGRIEAPDF
jgi:hypothetical protein